MYKKAEKLQLAVLAGLLEVSKSTLEDLRSYGIFWEDDLMVGRTTTACEALVRTKLRKIQLAANIKDPSRQGLLPRTIMVFYKSMSLEEVCVHNSLYKPSMRANRRSETSTLEITLTNTTISKWSMSKLFSPPGVAQLTKLDLKDVQLQAVEPEKLVTYLERALSLKTLRLSGIHCSRFEDAIAILERCDQHCGECCKKEIELRMPVSSQSELVKLTAVVRSTKSIACLGVSIVNHRGVSPTYILRGLEGNICIRRFTVRGNFLRPPHRLLGVDQSTLYALIQKFHDPHGKAETNVVGDAKALESVLESNASLTNVSLINGINHPYRGHGEVPFLSDTAKFWMKLNNGGRKKLTERPGNTKLWLDTLIQERADVKITYHLLTLNPSICVETGQPQRKAQKNFSLIG